MPAVTRAALGAFLAAAALAGCLSPSPSSGGALGPESPRALSFDLSLADVPAGADWVALAVDPGRNAVVTATSIVDFEFPGGVDPATSRACFLMSLNGTGPFAPILSAERADPGASGLANGQTVAARQQGQGGTVTVVTTGVAGEAQQIHAAQAVAGKPMLLLFGAPREPSLRPASMTVRLEGGQPFSYHLAGSGTMACLTSFSDMPEGDLAQGPGFVRGSGLAWHGKASGMAAWVDVEADLSFDAALLDPSGQPAWEAHGTPLGGSQGPAFACGAAGGDWTLSIPEVAGTSNRAAHLEALLVDLPGPLQSGFNCSGESRTL